MKRIERFNLISDVARELQSRMTYDDISTYLKGFGVNVDIEGSFSSKWVYSKTILADVDDSLIIQIADELDVPHGHTVTGTTVNEVSKFWVPGYFRLFIGHLSEHKLKATALKEALKKYSISCFVAHEDIHPSLEWQNEIDKSLMSMDALTAILMPGFPDSNWTDQEIGYALGRGVLVLPLRNGLDPYGFIGKVQGVPCVGKTVAQVAEAVFVSLASNKLTRDRIANTLINQIIVSSSITSAIDNIKYLQKVEELQLGRLERLRDNLSANKTLSNNKKFIDLFNKLLTERGLASYQEESLPFSPDDDIPF